MKLKLSVLFISFGIISSVFSNELEEYRSNYYNVCLNKTDIHDFSDFLELHSKNDSNVKKGYQAAIWFLWADYYWNPLKKWNCFNKGKDSLDELINKNKNSIELRFLRFTIQDNSPDFLGYKSNMIDDKLFICKMLDAVFDADLRVRIINYLSRNGMTKIK